MSRLRRANVPIHKSKMSMLRIVMKTVVILLMRMTLMTMDHSYLGEVLNRCQTSLSSKETLRLYHL